MWFVHHVSLGIIISQRIKFAILHAQTIHTRILHQRVQFVLIHAILAQFLRLIAQLATMGQCC